MVVSTGIITPPTPIEAKPELSPSAGS
jgi:hypothetical protein